MTDILTYDALSRAVMRHFKKGVITNHMAQKERLERSIESASLRVIENGNGLILLTDRGDHVTVHFYMHSPTLADAIPHTDKPLTVEITHKAGDTRYAQAVSALECAGFQHVLTRKRYEIRAAEVQSETFGAAVADRGDIEQVRELLAVSFSPLTGCLPTAEELACDIDSGRALVLRDGGRVASLVHFSEDAKLCEIKHLCTRKEYRGRAMARALVSELLCRTKKRTAVWVTDGYRSAEAVYESLGFTPNGSISHVFVR